MRETRRSRLRLVSSSPDGLLDSLLVLVSTPEVESDQCLTSLLEFFLDSQAPVYDLAFRMLSKFPFTRMGSKLFSNLCK